MVQQFGLHESLYSGNCLKTYIPEIPFQIWCFLTIKSLCVTQENAFDKSKYTLRLFFAKLLAQIILLLQLLQLKTISGF